MIHFLDTNIREQKKVWNETPVDNTINDLRYEIKFEGRMKDKNNFFIKKQNIAFLFWTKIYFILEYILF